MLEIQTKNISPSIKKLRTFQNEKHWKRDAMKIAFRILDTLEENDLHQKDLAEKLGKTPQWVNKICKGHQNLTIGTIRKLEKALDIKLIEFVSVVKTNEK